MNRLIAIDSETRLIEQGNLQPRIVCLQYCDGTTSEILPRERGLEQFKTWLRDPSVHLCGHNLPFDLGCIVKECPELVRPIFAAIDAGRFIDTFISELLLRVATGEAKYQSKGEGIGIQSSKLSLQQVWDWAPEAKEKKIANQMRTMYGLDALLLRYLGIKISKGADTWRLRYSELDGVPIEEWDPDAVRYAIDDVRHLPSMRAKQKAELKQFGVAGEKQRLRVAFALHLMSCNGFVTDGAKVAELEEYLDSRCHALRVRLRDYGFYTSSLKGTWTKNLKAIQHAVVEWYIGRDGEVPETDKGGVATDKFALMPIDTEKFNDYKELQTVSQLRNTYLKHLITGVRERVTPRYHPVLESLRTSCRAPNWQNLPRTGGIRPCVVPRDGNVFVFCDYDTLELRTLAQTLLDLFGESRMAQALQEGRDLHWEMAASILALPYELVFGKIEYKPGRQSAKILNFGLPGGLGVDALIHYALGFGVTFTREEAERLYNLYFETWPEMRQYFNWVSAQIDRDSGMVPYIRHHRSSVRRGKIRFTAAANHMFQHLAAMGATEAMAKVVELCHTPGDALYGCLPNLFLHDEVGLEAPEKTAHKAAQRLEEVMQDTMQKWTPDIPITCTAVMTRAWHKGAEPVYNEGQLVPSKPEGKEWVWDKEAIERVKTLPMKPGEQLGLML